MPSSPEVRVHYAKGWAITILVLGVLCLVLAPLSRLWMTGVVGAMNTVLGIMMLIKPLYVLGDGALQVKNLIGMTLKRYTYSSLSEFDVRPDGSIWHQPPGAAPKKVRLSRLVVASADYKRLMDALTTRAFE